MQKTVVQFDEICGIYQETEKGLDKTVTAVIKFLQEKGETIATAESCTGGMLSELLTRVPGASNVFELGLVTYAARMKTKLLGVSAEDVDRFGVVSETVASEMLAGLKMQSGADVCISVTGLAGPDGGTPKQPVGTVFLGVLYRDGQWIFPLKLWQLGLKERQTIRRGTAVFAFGITKYLLMGGLPCRKRNQLH